MLIAASIAVALLGILAAADADPVVRAALVLVAALLLGVAAARAHRCSYRHLCPFRKRSKHPTRVATRLVSER